MVSFMSDYDNYTMIVVVSNEAFIWFVDDVFIVVKDLFEIRLNLVVSS